MIKLFFLFSFVFLGGVQSWSQVELPLTRLETKGTSKVYWTLYADNGVAKIDVIEERNAQAQQVIQSWGFSDFDKAERFFLKKTSHLQTLNEKLWAFETQTIKSLSNKKLWDAQNSWDWNWEIKYAKWVALNVDKVFMQKYQIPSDCADLAYILRWIFARENSLPVANKLSSTGKFMTHETVLKDWENLSTNPDWSKDQLFRTALRYLTRQTYTHTLMRDSYPIALNSEAVTEGVHHLQLREKSGHTMLVYRVDRSGGVPVRVLYSNVPIQVRELYEAPFSESNWPVQDKVAFLRFRWPQKSSSGWGLTASAKMPYYSLEQFSEELTKEGPSFFMVAFKRIAPNFDPYKIVDENLTSALSQFENRVKVVEDGFKFCQINDCSPGTAGDEDWSTPSRDRRIRETFDALQQAIDLYLEMTANSALPAELVEKMKNFRLSIDGESVSFAPLYVSALTEFMDSDPRVSVAERWAVKPKAIAQRMNRILDELFKMRDEKLKTAGSCSLAECPMSSKAWVDRSTADEDRKISSAFVRLRNLESVLKESVDDFNQAFMNDQKFKNYFSRAMTQHSSPTSSEDQRVGKSGWKVQFVPQTAVPIAFSENVFMQKSKIYRQKSGELFPQILCSNAQLNPKDGSSIVCIKNNGEMNDFEFWDRELKVVKTIKADPNQLIMYYWINKSDSYLFFSPDKLQIYNSRGDLTFEFEAPKAYNVIRQRWLSTLDENRHLKILDLARVENGWVEFKTRALDDFYSANVFNIGETGFFLVSDSLGTDIVNSSGEVTYSTIEQFSQFHDQLNIVVTSIVERESKVFKFYRFQSGTLQFLTQIRIQSLQNDWTLGKTPKGFYYGSRSSGYSTLDLTTLQIQHFPWTKEKQFVQFDVDSFIFLDQTQPPKYGLYNLNGEIILQTAYIVLQSDSSLELQRMSFFNEHIFYNQTHEFGKWPTPLFSNSGFSFIPQPENRSLSDDWNPRMQNQKHPGTYVFGINSGQAHMPLLFRLGIELDYSSILLTEPH